MLRRSRISVRPNVRPVGRGPAPGSSQEPSQEAPATDPQDTGDPAKAGSQEGKDPPTPEGTGNPSEPPTLGDDGKEKNGEASSSAPPCSAGSQRRKRYSVMPNLAKPRVTPALTRSTNRTSRSPVKATSETRVPASAPDSGVPGPSDQTLTTVPRGVRSPRRRRPSGGARQPIQAKPTSPGSPDPSPADQSEQEEGGPQQGPPSEHPEERQLANSQSDVASTSQTKDAPPPVLEKATPSLPSREASELSERAEALVSRSVKCGLSLAPGKSRLSRLLNDPTDLQRLAKARKLRELLKQEMNKERKSKKAKVCAKEYTVDPSKMTMRDLIYYLPDSNPMTSFVEDKRAESEIVIPNSPSREESPERLPEREKLPEPASQREEEEGDADEDEGDSDAGQDDQLMVPRVKVAEDGSLIIDEESLTVEVLRAKGPNPMEDRDPIFERGSTTTYSSFRKPTYSKPWSSQETDMFYLAISMVGTDFSMIGQLFPHRARIEIKNKFKREERENGWRIDKAFKERRKMDVEFFSNLLEKILAIGKKKKKAKSPTEKKVRNARKSKPKAKKLSDVEEEDEEGAELEGEKENEAVLNEDGTAGATPKKKRRRSADDGASSPAKSKKNKKDKSLSEDEAGVPEDSEAALPEDQSPLESSQKADEAVPASKGPVIKPAQLSRGRAPRPIPTLGRRWGQKSPAPSTGPRGATSTAADKSTEDSTPQEQKVASPSEAQGRRQDARQSEEVHSSDEEEETTVAPARPTRYGRTPKPTQHLNYPAKDDGPAPACDAASEGPSGSPSSSKAKPTARRGKVRPGPSLPRRKGNASPRKPKLVTLRASQSEESEEEGEGAPGEGLFQEEDLHLPTSPAMESQAPVFVPYALRSPQPVVSELEETMEELDISINMPDVLGIPDGALCPDASCQRGEGGAGGEVPCEHQLDLLVDVIDFLSPEPMEESEESYNEAARTLLTISNQTLLSQDTQDCCTETSVLIEDEPQHQSPTDQSQSDTGAPATPDPVVAVAPRLSPDPSATTADSVAVRQGSDAPPTQGASTNESKPEPPSRAETDSEGSELAASQTRRTRLPKPKPNLGRTSRSAPSKPRPADETLARLKPVERPSTPTAPSEAQPGEGIALPSPQTTAPPSPQTTAPPSPQTTAPPSRQTTAPPSPQITAPPSPQTTAPPSPQTTATPHPNCLPSCAPPSPKSTFPAVPEGATPSMESLASQSVVTETSKAAEASETIARPDSVPPTPETSDGPPADFQPTAVVSTNQGTGCKVVPAPPEESGSESSEQIASQAKRSRFPKLKPKPNLGRASRTSQPKPQLAAETSVQLKPVESSSTVAASSEARPDQKDAGGLPGSIPVSKPLPAEDKPSLVPPTDTSMHSAHPDKEQEGQIGPSLLVKPGSQPAVQETAGANGSVSRAESGSDSSDPSVPQPRRTRFPKPKPNLGRASRTAQSKPQPAEETSTSTSKSLPAEVFSAPSEPQPSSDTPGNTISSTGSSPCLGPSEDQPGGDLRRSGPPDTSAPVLMPHTSPPGEAEEGVKQPSCAERETSSVEARRLPVVDPAHNPPKGLGTARLPKLKPSLACGGQATLSHSSWCATPSKPGPSVKKSTLGQLAAQILDISKPPSRRKAKRPLGGDPCPETTAQTRWQIPAEDGGASVFSTAATVDVIQTPCVEDQSSPVTRTNSEAGPVDLAPSDPEEPFFILSLTEIPVFLSGEEMAPAPLPFLQGPEPACLQAHSTTAVPGEEVTSGSDGVLQNVPEPTVEPEGMVRSEEARTDACEEPAVNEEEAAAAADPPRKKRKLPDKSGRAKPEVKSTATRKEQVDLATSARPSSSASSSAQPREQPPSEPDLAPVPSPASPRTQASPVTAGPATSQERAPTETRGGAVGPTESSGRAGVAEDGGLTLESRDVHGITPLAASSPLNRPGRRPRGFLSFMADKSSPSPTGGPRGTKAASRKPQLGTSRPGKKVGAPALTSSAPSLTSSIQTLTSSAPALTSSAPALTSSAPALTSSIQTLTSSAPDLTSSAPDLTSSAPALTSSAPALTSSAPALTSSAPALTSSAPALTPPAEVEASGPPDVSCAWAHLARPEPRVSSQSGPSTFQCSSTAEVEGWQQSEVSPAAAEEEEDISVSQYFFSDIFTEVENEG